MVVLHNQPDMPALFFYLQVSTSYWNLRCESLSILITFNILIITQLQFVLAVTYFNICAQKEVQINKDPLDNWQTLCERAAREVGLFRTLPWSSKLSRDSMQSSSRSAPTAKGKERTTLLPWVTQRNKEGVSELWANQRSQIGRGNLDIITSAKKSQKSENK